jgi:hypothetical protein
MKIASRSRPLSPLLVDNLPYSLHYDVGDAVAKSCRLPAYNDAMRSSVMYHADNHLNPDTVIVVIKAEIRG